MLKEANIGYEEEMVFEKIMDQDFERAVKSHQISNRYLSSGGKKRNIIVNTSGKE